jgi:hypothetical protein
MTPYEEALQLTDRLSLVEQVQLLEHLSSHLKQSLQLEAYRHIPWEEFLERTYGSLAHDPIERDQPPEADVRDPIE